ncbi:MAG TPA: hypothetical protein VLD63_14590 [Anaerolineales bacterium]|nr:hypothetical protein [Anaerolineales bacterium]
MSSPRDNTVLWIGGGLLAALVCCLCLALSVGGLSYWIAREAANTVAPGVPTAEILPLDEATSVPRLATPVPAEAEAMRDALAALDVPVSDPIGLAERLQGIENIPQVLADHADPVALGTSETFWATDVDTNESFQVTARLAYATEHVYFWVEEGVEARQADIQALVDEFEQKTYPTDREFFGSEWTPGVDGDPHLYILFANGLGSSIAGYYSSSDEYSSLAHEYSNGHEMFYLMAENLSLRDEFTSGVLAHEFQHMIHWYRDRNEESWMNEGFSEVAAFLNGFDVGGFDYEYATDPDLTLTYWPAGGVNSNPHYGQSFLILAYFLDRFGEDATKTLVAQTSNGLDSIDQTLTELDSRDPETGEPIRADDVVADWAAALLVQDPSVGDGRFAYNSYRDAPSPSLTETVNQCPGSSGTRTVSQYGVDYIRIACDGDYTLTFDGSTIVPVVPAEPASGSYAFWSNRGDESDMTLTHAFDLRDVTGPVSLDYRLWYELEEDYDYAYLEVSTDNGATWTILTTPSGTADDPTGASYGWAYNGFSGGGDSGEWIDESVDLSEFAGQEIQLRFEYVTDAAVNLEGLMVDDVRLDALGYHEDFEQGDGGWEGQGFVRLYNRLPQTYRVMLVTRGDQTTVQPIALDDNQHGEVSIHIGDSVQDVVLIVIGTARHTWQTSDYSYQLTR